MRNYTKARVVKSIITAILAATFVCPVAAVAALPAAASPVAASAPANPGQGNPWG